MNKKSRYTILTLLFSIILMGGVTSFAQDEPPEYTELPVVSLRSLDKITARTMTFEATVGKTVKFGSLYIKAQTCRKSSPLDKPESAAFLQVWENITDEVTAQEKPEWVFSGWMFASSPALSAMDHPIYDVWVLDCLEEKGQVDPEQKREEEERGEGEIEESSIPAKPAPGDVEIPATE